MKAKGHSLWLMPTDKAYNKLTNLIRKIAVENNALLFEPHLNLLGEVPQSQDEVIKRTEQLVFDQKPFPVTLQTVDYEDFYFRALFVRAKITDSLLALHNRSKDVFEMANVPPYMPHLSLLYGNFPQDVKEKIIETIGRDQTTQFTVGSVHLYKTDGEVNTWYKVEEFTLS